MGLQMNDELIAQVVDDADSAHLAHLVSTSYAQHEALGEFYVEVRKRMDSLVEAPVGLDVSPPTPPDSPILPKLEAGLIELNNMRDGFCQGSPVLENLYDELCQTYVAAIYKLKRFQ